MIAGGTCFKGEHMNIRRRLSSTALALIVSVASVGLSVSTAHAFCGFYVAGGESSLFNDATQVVMMRHGQRTVLSMQNNYQGPPENFAMVVPVPVVLQQENVKTLNASIFAKIAKINPNDAVDIIVQAKALLHTGAGLN